MITTIKNNLTRVAMLLLLVVLGSVGVWAQTTDNATETITIGSDNGGRYDLPISAENAYLMTQQEFYADQINHGEGDIWSLGFQTENGDLTRNVAIYITNSEQSTSGDYGWWTVTNADCVFSGEVTFVSGQWNTIYFNKPFHYDGKSNLILTYDDNTGEGKGWGSLTNHTISGSHKYAYSDKNDLDPTDLTTLEKASYKSSVGYQSQIRFTFTDKPSPGGLTVSDIADKSAQIATTLRGEGTAWNLRYRKVSKDGEEAGSFVTVNNLTTRSYSLEDLDPGTKYEAQVQAVYEGDNLSEWTSSVTFVTACCPIEEQTEMMFALGSQYIGWYNYAVQIVDITDEDKPVEVAHLRAPSSQTYGGTVTLCCGHKYQVNWIYDADMAVYSQSYYFSLYYNTGDLLYTMARGEAPEETAELTTFIMDCTPYCAQKPQNVNVLNTTYNSATITLRSETKAGEAVYSTEADFDPDAATTTSVNYDAVSTNNMWEQYPANASLTLTGLEPLTKYYVQVRNVCTGGNGHSRWSDPVEVITGSRYDGPRIVKTESVNSRTEKITFENGGTSKKSNLYYRVKVQGTPISAEAIQTIGTGNGTGFKNGESWGEGIRASGGNKPYSNILYTVLSGLNSYNFQAGQGKTGLGLEKFIYGIRELVGDVLPGLLVKQIDRECMNDADREARIKLLEERQTTIEKQRKKLVEDHDNGDVTNEEFQEQFDKLVSEEIECKKEVESLSKMPTDAQKLARMKELEKKIEDAQKTICTLDPYSEEYKTLKAEMDVDMAELNKLRVMTSAAENVNKDGFSVSKEEESGAQARTRSGEDRKFVFFIRHSNGNGTLLIRNLTFTPNELLNDWICIPNISGTEYTLTGLMPNTTYEVMVEPVFEDGITGTQSPIASFTTLGEESEPLDGAFSVSADKKVSFAKGNLQYSRDANWNDHWKLAEHQYDILGLDNLQTQEVNEYGNRLPSEDHLDLFCWSNKDSNKGTIHTYPDDSYYTGDFVEWGAQSEFIEVYGPGWQTLSKDEWTYLLSGRENADKLKALATVNNVKGLILLPDDWTGDAPAATYTAETWATLETAGAVFLPAAGTLTVSSEDSHTIASVNGLDDGIGSYWSSTPSETDINAFATTFNATEVKPAEDIYRRIGSAVRLVKVAEDKLLGDANGDGVVDAADIVEMVNAKDDKASPNFKMKNVDFDGDGKVTDSDIEKVVDIIMGN